MYDIDAFKETWEDEAAVGRCDAYGSAEYNRVFQEWLDRGCEPQPRSFIRRRANRPPTDPPGPASRPK